MSAFKIGGSRFNPASGVSNTKKNELAKAEEEQFAQRKGGGFDTVKLNRLAVMPRMSAAAGQSAERLRGEAVESLLKDSAAELDDYFSEAYGFKK